MKSAASLIMVSWILFSALPIQSQTRQPVLGFGFESIPLYGHVESHAQELLGYHYEFQKSSQTLFKTNRADRSLELAQFISQTTFDLLPNSYSDESPYFNSFISDAIIKTANKYEMDPLILMSIIKTESQFNPNAKGAHGEIGLMQIKPSTALWLAEKKLIKWNQKNESQISNYSLMQAALLDPVTNIEIGASYLAHLRKHFNRQGNLYLLAYNMGAVNLKSRLRNGERPRIYSDRILHLYTQLSQEFLESTTKHRSLASLPMTLGQL